MTVEKPKPRQLLWPITTGTGNAMNQSQFLLITCNSLEARQKSRVHGAIGFGFDSHWLKNWCESFKPITKRSNRNHVITFDSHLKTALIDWNNKLVSCALDEGFFCLINRAKRQICFCSCVDHVTTWQQIFICSYMSLNAVTPLVEATL